MVHGKTRKQQNSTSIVTIGINDSQVSSHKTCENILVYHCRLLTGLHSYTQILCGFVTVSKQIFLHYLLSFDPLIIICLKTCGAVRALKEKKRCLLSWEEGIKLMINPHIECPEEAAASIIPLIQLNWGVTEGEVGCQSRQEVIRIRERTWETSRYHCIVSFKASLAHCCQTNHGDCFPRALVEALLYF